MADSELNFEKVYFNDSNFNFLNKDILKVVLKLIDEVDDLNLLFNIYQNEVSRINLLNRSREYDSDAPNCYDVNSNSWFELCKIEEVLRKINELNNKNNLFFGNLKYSKELFRNDIEELIYGFNNLYKSYNKFNFYNEETQELYLCQLKIFSRDKIDIVSNRFISVNFEELKKIILDGKLISNEKSGINSVELTALKGVKDTNTRVITHFREKIYFVQELENIKEIDDLISTNFEGKLPVDRRCLIAYDEFIKNPHEINKHKLLLAYEMVPYHKRRYLFEMGVDDEPIRDILYIFNLESSE